MYYERLNKEKTKTFILMYYERLNKEKTKTFI